MRILVLHGPYLSLAHVDDRLGALARELDAEVVIQQSDDEGSLIDALHAHIDKVDGVLINPGALAQHAAALRDAIEAMPVPVLEVHMANIEAREHWRGHSIISGAATGVVQGLDSQSYVVALRTLVEVLREGKGSGAGRHR